MADPAEDYTALRRDLLREIEGKGDAFIPLETQVHGTSGEKLLQFAFLDAFSPEVVAKISATPQGDRFIQALRGNPVWLRMLMTSGPILKPEPTLNHLASLWKQDPACAKETDSQTLAVATALEFGRNEWSLERAWTRYAFYRDSQKLELLHPIYDDLAAWEKRYLTGHSLGTHGEEKSQVWLRDNVKLPVEGYRAACWQLAYRGHNFFGDSVQGPMYYFPYQGSFNSFSEMTRYVGGVCGRLSGYGAGSAVANGIPATTMGEPGHCAYTVRVARGQWKPAYSLSWKRGVHVRLYESGSYNLLVLTEDIFADEGALQKAYAHLWQAKALGSSSQRLVNAAYLQAIKAQPINYEVWKSYGEWLSQQKGDQRSSWKTFHSAAIQSYSAYPEVAWMLISRYAYPPLLKGQTPADKIRILGEFHQSISEWGPNRWDFEGVIAKQVKWLGGGSADQFLFFQGLLTLHKDSAAYSGPTLGWGQSHFSKSMEQRKKFIVVATRTMTKGNNEDGEKALYGMANRLILDAEKNNDASTFQLAGSMLRQIYTSKAKFKPAFPGELLSEGGMIRLSGTSRYDTPWKHYFLPSREPGYFHTGRQANPWVELAMKQFGELSGIEVVNWTKFHNRAVPLKVEVSEDGKSWQKIEVLKKPQAVWKIDLQGRNIRARYIRLTKQGHDFLHLNNIRVYGKRRS